MSTLTDITSTLKLASNEFELIKLTPNDDDLQCLNKVFVICCLGVTLTGKDASCASGVVLHDIVYKSHHRGISFDIMHNAQDDYNPAIAALTTPDALALKLHRIEHVWATGTANQNCIRAVKLGTHNLIIANVESTWVQELRNTFTFFTGVSPRKLLDHISNHAGVLDRIACVEIILSLKRLWESNPQVNQFIINMEEAQKKSVRAILPIINNMLVMFATYMLLKAGYFP